MREVCVERVRTIHDAVGNQTGLLWEEMFPGEHKSGVLHDMVWDVVWDYQYLFTGLTRRRMFDMETNQTTGVLSCCGWPHPDRTKTKTHTGNRRRAKARALVKGGGWLQASNALESLERHEHDDVPGRDADKLCAGAFVERKKALQW